MTSEVPGYKVSSLEDVSLPKNTAEVNTDRQSSTEPSLHTIDQSLIDSILTKVRSTWTTINSELNEIGVKEGERKKKQMCLLTGLYDKLNEISETVRNEKTVLKNNCVSLQKQIFKILRIFSKSGYRTSVRRSPSDESSEISDETYTEINQIFTNEDEFNDIMKAIPDKYTKEYIVQKISPPYNECLSYLTLVAKLLAKEYFSRLLKFLRIVMLLKEYADEIDFYCENRPGVDQSSIKFFESLPTIEQCKVCVRELEKVSGSESNIDMIYKVVTAIVKANNFNNLSKTYLNRIQYQVELVEIEKERIFEIAIECANNIMELWRTLYNLDEGSEDNFDRKIIKCSEGDTTEIGLKLSSLSYLNETYNNLLKEKQQRKKDLQSCLDECHALFEILKENPEIVEEFDHKYDIENDLSSRQLQALKLEVEKLKEKKKYYMKDIIDFVKVDIEKIWQNLYFTEEEKLKMQFYYSDEYTDEALDYLESRLSDLQKLTANFTPMYDRIGQFNVLLSDKRELDEASKNPSRLLARNSGLLLLQEEKKRKALKRRFPKVCSELENFLMEYDNATKDKIKNSDYYELLNKVREEAESLNGKKIIDYNSKRQSPSRTSPVRLSPVRDEKLQTRKVSPSRMLKKISPTKPELRPSPNRLLTKSSPIRFHAKSSPNRLQQRSPPNKQSPLKFGYKKISPRKMTPKKFSPMKLSPSKFNSLRSPNSKKPLNYAISVPISISGAKNIIKKQTISPQNFKKSEMSSLPENGLIEKPKLENYIQQNGRSPMQRMSPNRNFVPSVRYNVPLNSIKITKPPKKKRKSLALSQEPDNIFFMDPNKENLPLGTDDDMEIDFAKLKEAESFGPIDYKELERPAEDIKEKVKSRTNILRDTAVYDTLGDDSMYRDWRSTRLLNLRSNLNEEILLDSP